MSGLPESPEPDIIRTDSAGGTSRGSGNPPAVFLSYPKTYAEAVSALLSAGFVDAGTPHASYVLRRVGCYHLQPYLGAALRSGAASVKAAHDLLCFDRRFQALLFEYIGVFELQFRAQYAHHMNANHGEGAIYDPGLFLNRDRHASSVGRIRDELGRKSRRGGGVEPEAPVWAALDCSSLGTLSKLYANTADSAVRRAVADSFGVAGGEFRSWVATVSDARNRCAHFDCLAFKGQISSPPKKIRGLDCPNTVPLYVVLLLERLLSGSAPFADLRLHYSVELATRVRIEVSELLAAYPGAASQMGLPENWSDLIFDERVVGRR